MKILISLMTNILPFCCKYSDTLFPGKAEMPKVVKLLKCSYIIY